MFEGTTSNGYEAFESRERKLSLRRVVRDFRARATGCVDRGIFRVSFHLDDGLVRAARASAGVRVEVERCF